ncbi:hypothetical protein Tco_0394709 [Tanacetum coccineum]
MKTLKSLGSEVCAHATREALEHPEAPKSTSSIWNHERRSKSCDVSEIYTAKNGDIVVRGFLWQLIRILDLQRCTPNVTLYKSSGLVTNVRLTKFRHVDEIAPSKLPSKVYVESLVSLVVISIEFHGGPFAPSSLIRNSSHILVARTSEPTLCTKGCEAVAVTGRHVHLPIRARATAKLLALSMAKRNDSFETAGLSAHIISLPEYDHFCFKIEPELGNLTMDVVEDIFPTREPRVHVPNVLPTHPTLNLDLDFILFSDSLFTYIVWIFLPFLTYPVAPPYLLSCGNEDTIFDPGISVYHSFMLGVSHQSGTFMKFNVYLNNLNKSLMEILSSTCSPMDQ